MKNQCKISARCGGCLGLNEPIEKQLKDKTDSIKKLFAGYEDKVHDCVCDFYPLKYRNKVHLAFGELKGRTLIGFYEEGSNKIQDVEDCLLFGPWLKTLIATLREYVSRFKIRPYNFRDGSGVLRYAHARCVDNKLQLTLVVTTDNFAGRDWLYHALSQNFSEVSFYLNINRRTDHAVFDKYFKFVKGARFLTFTMAGVKVSISPSSFLQVNLSIAEKMYKKALEELSKEDADTILDLYSGCGITSIMFAKKFKTVLSVEEVSSAVDNAKYMAKLNDVKNIRHIEGKCENSIGAISRNENCVVFVDPARAGMEKSVIDALMKLNSNRIVYMSCNPETCLRDIKIILTGKKYQIKDIMPYLMFPYTKHVELLIVLEKTGK